MRRTLQLMSALALFFCALNLNAQNEAPKVTVKNVKGAAVTIIDSQYHFPYDISDNKQHVAIQAFGESQSLYWSENTGLIEVDGTVFAISDDGIMAGYYTNDQGMVVSGLWHPDMQQWQFLGMNPDYPEFFTDNPDYNNAWAMYNDGLHVGIPQFGPDWSPKTHI